MTTWPLTFRQCLQLAERYRASRQYADAAVEYLKAAERAPDRECQTEMLENAYDVTREAEKAANRAALLDFMFGKDDDAHLGATEGE